MAATHPARRGVDPMTLPHDTDRLLTIGTGHVPPEANDDDRWALVPADPVECGWWLYVPSEAAANGLIGEMPLPVQIIICFARRLGCRYVHIDQDGPELAELDWWDW